jgi:hypothetical protein
VGIEKSIQPIVPVTLHEDAFYEFFRPYRHQKSNDDIWGGLGLETFGADFELVSNLDPNTVWTVVESGCNDDQWILPGIHIVNRVCYLVTEIAHNWEPLEFRVPSSPSTLTELGLTQQINKLNQLIKTQKI